MGNRRIITALLVMLTVAPAASANVITDWDEIAVKTIQTPGPVPPVPVDLVFRASAMVNVAMFDAVNCIEPRYQSYKMQVEPSPDTSQDVAAASAAANVLMQVVPSSNVKATLTEYLAKIPGWSCERPWHQAGRRSCRQGRKDACRRRLDGPECLSTYH